MDKIDLIQELKRHDFSEKIINAFGIVRREDFVLPNFLDQAYDNIALPLGEGSTISQPYTIAFMLEHMQLEKGQRILEIGSGCGYVLALIADIIGDGEIFGVELNKKVVDMSFEKIKHPKIKIYHENGRNGLEEHAPYDRILVSAAYSEIPYHLTEQLKEGGIIVTPVRNSIYQVKKQGEEIIEREFPGFTFVPIR